MCACVYALTHMRVQCSPGQHSHIMTISSHTSSAGKEWNGFPGTSDTTAILCCSQLQYAKLHAQDLTWPDLIKHPHTCLICRGCKLEHENVRGFGENLLGGWGEPSCKRGVDRW